MTETDLRAPAWQPRDEPGALFLTLSVMVDHRRLEEMFTTWDDKTLWNQDLLQRIRELYQDSGPLNRAIEPFFEDIADRRRSLFVTDFLLATPSRHVPGEKNVCETVCIVVPQDVRWATEGASLRVDLGGRASFPDTQCRAFWLAHSNGSLSYHLSLEIVYRHCYQDYYALAALQKALFPTEGTETWINTAQGLQIHRDADGPPLPQDLWSFVRALFNQHARHLFPSLSEMRDRQGVPVIPARTLWRPPGGNHDYWEKLLGNPSPQAREDAANEPTHARAGVECRAVLLLRDQHFFELLQPAQRLRIRGFQPIASDTENPGEREARLVYLPRHFARFDPAGAGEAERLDYYFLSGFLQNIIDFANQDTSEVKDGTDPIYPPAGQSDAEEHFLVYATQNAVYEIVASSRSLDAGRQWIGTCPYLFLVHMMSFHNEALVQRFEREVVGLIRETEQLGIRPGLYSRAGPGHQARIGKAFEAFREFRLRVFEEVQKHVYSNVLRYDTEQAFYSAVERVRGIGQRRASWEDVLKGLEDTIDDIRDDWRQRDEKGLNRVVIAITVFSALQVFYQIFQLVYEGKLSLGPAFTAGPAAQAAQSVAQASPSWLAIAGQVLLGVSVLGLLMLAGLALFPTGKRWARNIPRAVRRRMRQERRFWCPEQPEDAGPRAGIQPSKRGTDADR